MITSKKKIEREEPGESNNETVDPFAGDFFGVESGESDSAESIPAESDIADGAEQEKFDGGRWAEGLPKISAKEIAEVGEFSVLPEQINEKFRELFCEKFAKITKLKKIRSGSKFFRPNKLA